MAAGQGLGEGERNDFLDASSLAWESIVETQVGPKVERPVCDTCRKEWLSEHSSRGLSPWGCRETSWALPSSAQGEGVPWGQDSQR